MQCVRKLHLHIIGITESWANIDITDAELGLTGYVMFRKDRIGRRGGGVSGNSKLTIGLVYQSPNINEEDNTKIKTL